MMLALEQRPRYEVTGLPEGMEITSPRLVALADCGKCLPPHEAALADHGKPRLFHRSAKWKKVMDDFFHGQLEAVCPSG